MNKRTFLYLFLPLLVLVIIGIILNVVDFKYIEQYITVSGPILAAFVALFISDSVAYRERHKDSVGTKALLKHVRVLIKEAVDTMKLEAGNYDEFVKNLQLNGMKQTYLKTTPFHYVNEIASINKQILFNTILSIDSHTENQLIECYLAIVNSVENARFLKMNARDQFVLFIESYNQYAATWKSVQLEINKLYGDIETNPSEHEEFDQAFRDVIEAYNSGLHQGQIDFFNIQNIFDSLHNPLNHVLHNYFFQHPYIARLQQELKKMEVALDKIWELQNIAIEHYGQINKDLIKVADKLAEQIPHL